PPRWAALPHLRGVGGGTRSRAPTVPRGPTTGRAGPATDGPAGGPEPQGAARPGQRGGAARAGTPGRGGFARAQLIKGAIGKEPSTVTSRQCSPRALRARWTRVSSAWPSKSTKKRYSGLGVLAGNDSIQVRLILFWRETSSASTSEPGVCGTRNITAVLSFAVRADFWWPITAKRVSLCGESSMCSNRMRSPKWVAAWRLATAAAPGSICASRAASAVLETSLSSACGTFLDSQLRHCDRAWGLL